MYKQENIKSRSKAVAVVMEGEKTGWRHILDIAEWLDVEGLIKWSI